MADKYREKAPRRPRQCRTAFGVAKRSYSKQDALEGADRLRAAGNGRVNAYRCDHCGWWHVGTLKRSSVASGGSS